MNRVLPLRILQCFCSSSLLLPSALASRVPQSRSAAFVPGVSKMAMSSSSSPPVCEGPPGSPRWLNALHSSLAANTAPQDRFVQLGTVTVDGRPAVRTVVFRGFMGEQKDWGEAGAACETLSFITDARSDKMKQGREAEVCWYFAPSREQYRLRGVLDYIEAYAGTGKREADRKSMWKKISPAARKQFLWPNPGEERGDTDEMKDKEDFDEVDVSETEPPDTFVLVLLRPERVDHLQIKGFPQRRAVYQRSGDAWSEAKVNP